MLDGFRTNQNRPQFEVLDGLTMVGQEINQTDRAVSLVAAIVGAESETKPQITIDPKTASANRIGLRKSPATAARRAIVQSNPQLSARDLCKRFDLEPIALVPDWSRKYGVKSWSSAYNNPTAKKRIDRIISGDKQNSTGR